MRVAAALCLILCATGCAHFFPEPDPALVEEVQPQPAAPQELPPPAAEPQPPPSIDMDLVLSAARDHVGRRTIMVDGKRYQSDCSSFVRAVYSRLGVDLWALGGDLPGANGVLLIEKFVERYGERLATDKPQPGDIVFFDNTYDRNKNGRVDDPLTHVGLVEEVLADGSIHVLHHTHHGIVRETMNLQRPADHKDEAGNTLNDYLRAKRRREPAGVPHLMGELFAGFGRLTRLNGGVEPAAVPEVPLEPDEPDDAEGEEDFGAPPPQ